MADDRAEDGRILCEVPDDVREACEELAESYGVLVSRIERFNASREERFEAYLGPRRWCGLGVHLVDSVRLVVVSSSSRGSYPYYEWVGSPALYESCDGCIVDRTTLVHDTDQSCYTVTVVERKVPQVEGSTLKYAETPVGRKVLYRDDYTEVCCPADSSSLGIPVELRVRELGASVTRGVDGDTVLVPGRDDG